MLEIVLGNIKLEQFKDESIVITDSIQNVKDFQKIFTEYSEQFTLPASQINNDAFKHYYNFDVINGFDARIKKPCKLLLNGAVKYDGYLQLNGVSLENNAPVNYKVYFTGKTSKIKDIMKNDKLQDLSYLSNYDHEYNVTNVREGIENELFNGVIKYPFISAIARLVKVSSNMRKVSEDGTISADPPVYNEDFKPAIQLYEIILAIEEQYDELTFSRDFFGTAFFKSLYMWLHRGKGRAVVDFAKKTFNRDNLAFLGVGDPFTYPVDGIFRIVDNPNDINPVVETEFQNIQTYDEINLLYTITVDGEFTYEIVDELNGNILATGSGDDAAPESAGLSLQLQGSYKPVLIVTTTDETATSITGNLEIECIDRFRDSSGQPQTNLETSEWEETLATTSDFIIQDQIPEMKVIEFIESLFKMFNLTAFVDENNLINVKPLDDYYRQGKDIEITNQIDIEKSEVKRIDTFNEINFKFAEPKTIFRKAFSDENGRNYGDLEFNVSQVLGDSEQLASVKPYNIELTFEKMLFSELQDNNGDAVGFNYGASVDENNQSIKIKPLILCMRNQSVSAFNIGGEGTATVSIDAINEPTNFVELSTGVFQSINFGTELLGETAQDFKTIYELYYENYIRSIFAENARLIKLKARLRNDVLLNYKLNDRLIINNRAYRINQLKHNYLTGVSDLELMNDLIKLDFLFVEPLTASFDNTGGNQTFTVTSSVDWLVSNLPSWISSTGLSGSGNGLFKLTIAANSNPDDREATITVSGEGITQIVTINQTGSFLNVTPTASFSPTGGVQNINVVSNVSWSLTGLPSWLSADITSGTGDATIQLTATANETSSTRDVTLTISGGGLSRNVFVSQENIILSISPNSKTVAAFGESYNIAVTSNSEWEIVSSPAWVSTSPSTGIGNDSVFVNPTPNGTGSERTGDIIFESGSVQVTHEIRQNA